MEAWKSLNITGNPVKLENNQLRRDMNGREVRSTTVKLWKEHTKVSNAKESFIRDTAKLWNNAPMSVKNAKSMNLAKKEIVKYCKAIHI